MGMRVSKKLEGAPIRPKAHHSTSAYNYRWMSHRPEICITTVRSPTYANEERKNTHVCGNVDCAVW